MKKLRVVLMPHDVTKRMALSLLLLSALPFHVAAAPGPDAREDIAEQRKKSREQLFTWQPFSKEAFDLARREKRFVLLHGAAEWCHWCHVMEETTYRDAQVGGLLRDRFVVIRVDADSNPEFAERYGAWGWPATIVLSPTAEELGKYRGYMPPEQMMDMLTTVTHADARRAEANRPTFSDVSAPVEALPWIAARVMADLDSYFDDEEGSWGRRQKLPLGPNIEVELRRAAHGDERARHRAALTLRKQRALIDPVWGGVYQYSTSRDWTSVHFEKLMIIQAPSLEAYARGHAVLKDGALLADAKQIARYMNEHLKSPDGAFYVNQDADVGAHDRKARFVDGHTYYALTDPERRKLGTPWVDTHVYARENGMAIQALLALHDAGGDVESLGQATRAADALLKTHVRDDGSVIHDATRPDAPRYLADAASLGRAYALLAVATRDARFDQAARRIADAMTRNFGESGSELLWAATLDPDAAGVFSRRTRPFSHQVLAARFFASLHRRTGEAKWQEKGKRLLAAAATPYNLDEEGRMLGTFVLTLDELGCVKW